jgi:tRNA threonylcarbamoyladenosine biosynthesis protein TsaB
LRPEAKPILSGTDIVLAFDTAAAHCAAAVLHGDRVVTRVEEMAKGQAERLVPMLDELLAEAGLDWQAVQAVAVGTGPGNFTGIRIAVALARGLALGLGVPAIGVTGFEAAGPADLVAIPAPRGQVYLKAAGGMAEIVDTAPDHAVLLADIPLTRILTTMAHIARDRAGTVQPRPAPFYLRGADAAPSSDPPPVILP